jgi:hypothetical protein
MAPVALHSTVSMLESEKRKHPKAVAYAVQFFYGELESHGKELRLREFPHHAGWR